MMVNMQHSVRRGCQGYCLSLSGGFSASRRVRWLLGFSACPVASWLLGLPGGSGGFSACPVASRLARRLLGFAASRLARRLLGFAASRLLAVSGGFAASWLLGLSGGFSASRLVRWLLGFAASRLVSGFSASRLLGFWSHFWAPFARALQQRQKTGRAKEGNGRGGRKHTGTPNPGTQMGKQRQNHSSEKTEAGEHRGGTNTLLRSGQGVGGWVGGEKGGRKRRKEQDRARRYECWTFRTSFDMKSTHCKAQREK